MTATEPNIFSNLRLESPSESTNKLRGRSFDFVGDEAFKLKYREDEQSQKTKQKYSEFLEGTDEGKMTMTMNTTNRVTVPSSLNTTQNQLTQEMRQLRTYKGYQNWWNQKISKFRSRSPRKNSQKTLLEDEVKTLYVHPNKDKK
jgi:hypothetical protein